MAVVWESGSAFEKLPKVLRVEIDDLESKILGIGLTSKWAGQVLGEKTPLRAPNYLTPTSLSPSICSTGVQRAQARASPRQV